MFLLPYKYTRIKRFDNFTNFLLFHKNKLCLFLCFAVGANRLDQGSDEDNVFNDDASVISNVSCGSSMKDEGKNYKDFLM